MINSIFSNGIIFCVLLVTLTFNAEASVRSINCPKLDENLDSNFGKCGRLSPQNELNLPDYTLQKVVPTNTGFYIILNNYNHKLKVFRYKNDGTLDSEFNQNTVIDYKWDSVGFDADTDGNGNLIILLFASSFWESAYLVKVQSNGTIEFNRPTKFNITRPRLCIDKQSNNFFVIDAEDSYLTSVYAYTNNGESIESFGQKGKSTFSSDRPSGVEAFYWSSQSKQLKVLRDDAIFSIDKSGNVVKIFLSYISSFSNAEAYVVNDLGVFTSASVLNSNNYPEPSIYKRSVNGNIDKSFAKNGFFKFKDNSIQIDSLYPYIIPIYMDQNNSIYISFRESGSSMLLRLNSTGELERNFGGMNQPLIAFKEDDVGYLEKIVFLKNNSPILMMVDKKSPSYEMALFKLKQK